MVVAEITPITQIDRYTIGDGYPGLITQHLSSHYFSCVDGRGLNKIGFHQFGRSLLHEKVY